MQPDQQNNSFVKYIQVYLAVVITLGFFLTEAGLFFTKIEATNKDILLQMVGVLMAAVSGVMGYFLGASFGGAKNADTLASIATTVPIVQPVKVDDSVPIQVSTKQAEEAVDGKGTVT